MQLILRSEKRIVMMTMIIKIITIIQSREGEEKDEE